MSDDPRDLRLALPFDDEGDRPVPFLLTAAARRALDPADVPVLRVVPAAATAAAASPAPAPVPTGPDPDDLRPAQARALRRSGMRPATIAAAMAVEPATVEVWTADVVTARRRPAAGGSARRAGAARVARDRGGPARVAAAGRRLAGKESAVAAGLAVALARIDEDGGAVTLSDERPDLVAAAFGAVRAEVALAADAVRVAARCGPALAGDRVRADLAARLDLRPDRIVVGRWHGAPAADAVEVSVRIADRRAVRTVDAWACVAVPDRSLDVAR